jgi:phage terminase large subunit-like protein
MRGSDPLPSDEVLQRLPCFGGLDLASTQDLTAFAMLWRDDEAGCFYLRVHQFVNSEKAESKKLNAGIDYLRWAEEGHITVVPGNTTDYRYVKEHIMRQVERYDIRSIGYDPRFSPYIVSELVADDVEMHAMAQNITTMNGPTKEFEMEMLKGNIIHGGNEVLRWQIGCAVTYTDVNENKRVTKEKYSETKKVDGVIASIIAMNEYVHHRTNGSGDELFTVISL